MLELIDIARMEEARLAEGLSRTAPTALPFVPGADPARVGVMCRGEPGQWVNFAANISMHEEVSRDHFLALIDFYASKGIEPKLEVAPFCHESLRMLLEEHAFVTRLFENVFFCDLTDAEPAKPAHLLSADISIQSLDVTDEARLEEAGLLAIRGFAPPDYTPTAADHALFRRMATAAGALNVVAVSDNRMVGIAAAWLAPTSTVAMLGGAVTHPDFRRQGIQQALMAARLNTLRSQGVKLATIGSKPGIATERNARRMGFQLAYTKLHMVQPGPGRAPIIT